MNKLLRAGFARLLKNKVFWLLSLFSIGYPLFLLLIQYGYSIQVEAFIVNYGTIIGIVMAIFTSLFLGTEYSDGTIRNKISVGHKRMHIYLSNLLITATASLSSYFFWITVAVFVGIPMYGGITMPLSELLLMLGVIFVTVLAYNAIYTMLAMTISGKAVTAVVSVMLAFGLIMFALTWFSKLDESQFLEKVSVNEATDEVTITQTQEPNPKYLSGTKRKMYETLVDINPAGQMYRFAGRQENPNLALLPIYSLGLVVIFTAAGIVLFDKKDIK